MVAMSALAVAIVGGPLTMSFLALETTGSLPMTAAVLAAVVVSSLTVRRTFGYSFATWRFHLRGEVIRSAVDVGWVRSLTVGRMMRREVRTIRVSMPLAAFRRDFPLGSMERVIALDDEDRDPVEVELWTHHHANADHDLQVEAPVAVQVALHPSLPDPAPDCGAHTCIHTFRRSDLKPARLQLSVDQPGVYAIRVHHASTRKSVRERITLNAHP